MSLKVSAEVASKLNSPEASLKAVKGKFGWCAIMRLCTPGLSSTFLESNQIHSADIGPEIIGSGVK